MWPVFLFDGIVYAIVSVLFHVRPATLDGWWVGNIIECENYGIVVLAGYLAARRSGKVSVALAGGALFWFLWKPVLFVATGFSGTLLGEASIDRLLKTTIGAVIALAIFSPLALLASAIGGWLARWMLRRSERQITSREPKG
jgi:hypothetical protein